MVPGEIQRLSFIKNLKSNARDRMKTVEELETGSVDRKGNPNKSRPENKHLS